MKVKADGKPKGYDDGGHGGVFTGQGADLQAHLAYFDPRTQASFIWDGRSDAITVAIGGYGEPVNHEIPAHVARFGIVSLPWFAMVCEAHAKTLETF